MILLLKNIQPQTYTKVIKYNLTTLMADIDVCKILNCIGVRVMVFNATFNNISAIS